MLEEREKALIYLAGIIDGEGTIGIIKNDVSFYLVLEIGNTDKVLIGWLEDNFGGGVCLDKRSNKNPKHKDLYLWRHTGKKALSLLEEVEEYLLLKKPQAKIGIEFSYKCPQGTRGRKKLPYLNHQQNKYWGLMRDLNKKGTNGGEPELSPVNVVLSSF